MFLVLRFVSESIHSHLVLHANEMKRYTFHRWLMYSTKLCRHISFWVFTRNSVTSFTCEEWWNEETKQPKKTRENNEIKSHDVTHSGKKCLLISAHSPIPNFSIPLIKSSRSLSPHLRAETATRLGLKYLILIIIFWSRKTYFQITVRVCVNMNQKKKQTRFNHVRSTLLWKEKKEMVKKEYSSLREPSSLIMSRGLSLRRRRRAHSCRSFSCSETEVDASVWMFDWEWTSLEDVVWVTSDMKENHTNNNEKKKSAQSVVKQSHAQKFIEQYHITDSISNVCVYV